LIFNLITNNKQIIKRITPHNATLSMNDDGMGLFLSGYIAPEVVLNGEKYD
jgi:hypothetical protein